MSEGKKSIDKDPEFAAISAVYLALEPLQADARTRVLVYVTNKLGLHLENLGEDRGKGHGVEGEASSSRSEREIPAEADRSTGTESADGINSVAEKWMRRSGITVSQLSTLFSIGHDEIDLVAAAVPGKGKKDRMRAVILLKGIAAYLASGAARITHQQIKETCLHYDAYDGTNFAKHLKDFGPEVSGSKESGFTLTPRGLSEATKLVKTIAAESK